MPVKRQHHRDSAVVVVAAAVNDWNWVVAGEEAVVGRVGAEVEAVGVQGFAVVEPQSAGTGRSPWMSMKVSGRERAIVESFRDSVDVVAAGGDDGLKSVRRAQSWSLELAGLAQRFHTVRWLRKLLHRDILLRQRWQPLLRDWDVDRNSPWKRRMSRTTGESRCGDDACGVRGSHGSAGLGDEAHNSHWTRPPECNCSDCTLHSAGTLGRRRTATTRSSSRMNSWRSSILPSTDWHKERFDDDDWSCVNIIIRSETRKWNWVVTLLLSVENKQEKLLKY